MSRSRKKTTARNREWATVQGRIAWLVKTRFSGSRAALGRAIGFSHSIVADVVKERNPGPRLLDAIVTRLHVDRAWLVTGEGQPFAPTMRRAASH